VVEYLLWRWGALGCWDVLPGARGRHASAPAGRRCPRLPTSARRRYGRGTLCQYAVLVSKLDRLSRDVVCIWTRHLSFSPRLGGARPKNRSRGTYKFSPRG